MKYFLKNILWVKKLGNPGNVTEMHKVAFRYLDFLSSSIEGGEGLENQSQRWFFGFFLSHWLIVEKSREVHLSILTVTREQPGLSQGIFDQEFIDKYFKTVDFGLHKVPVLKLNPKYVHFSKIFIEILQIFCVKMHFK